MTGSDFTDFELGTLYSGLKWWPTSTDVIAVNRVIAAGYSIRTSVIDLIRLEAALVRPLVQARSGPDRNDVFDAASRIASAIAQAHAFTDGNKRTGMALLYAVLDQSQFVTVADPVEVARAIIRVVVAGHSNNDEANQATMKLSSLLRHGY